MASEYSFIVSTDEKTIQSFAEISGDWNPLHSDAEYAAQTAFQKPVLHGAYSAALVSRMAGMHLPGTSCLLHGLTLKFLSPVIPPVTLKVFARVENETQEAGSATVTISNAESGVRYVEGSYNYGFHKTADEQDVVYPEPTKTLESKSDSVYLVIGARGAVGGELLNLLGDQARGVSRTPGDGFISLDEISGVQRIKGIIHCGWPQPDNTALTKLTDATPAIGYHVSGPIADIVQSARILKENGLSGASLVLLGSSYADPGRHNFRSPLYSLSKSMIPTLTKILSLELAENKQRAIGMIFDVLSGGMNKRVSPLVLQTHADRNPFGELGSPGDAAGQIKWVLENSSQLLSGSIISLTASSLP